MDIYIYIDIYMAVNRKTSPVEMELTIKKKIEEWGL